MISIVGDRGCLLKLPGNASLQRDHFTAKMVASALSTSFNEPVSDQIVFVPKHKILEHLFVVEQRKVVLERVELNLIMARRRAQLAPPRP